jgi:hypothetical protein
VGKDGKKSDRAVILFLSGVLRKTVFALAGVRVYRSRIESVQLSTCSPPCLLAVRPTIIARQRWEGGVGAVMQEKSIIHKSNAVGLAATADNCHGDRPSCHLRRGKSLRGWTTVLNVMRWYVRYLARGRRCESYYYSPAERWEEGKQESL